MVSEVKQASIERAVAFHLGQIKRALDRGELTDRLMLNMDETHFVINMNDSTTLEKKVSTTVKYHDVVSGSEGMTVVAMLRGGVNARLEVPMLIFQNDKRGYPIRGLIGNVPGVTYPSGPRG